MPNTNAFTLEEINQILEQLNAHPGARLQYIGSRYVPIFGRKGEDSIEWDNTGTYEPLTVVLYQGNSYTSRQFVPVGIEITNGEYWAETGNYNAQIEQYRTEVAQIKDQQNSTNETISDLQTGLNNEAINRVNADTALQSQINTLNTSIENNSPGKYKKWVAYIFQDNASRQSVEYYTAYIENVIKVGFTELQYLLTIKEDGTIVENEELMPQYQQIASNNGIKIRSLKVHGNYSAPGYIDIINRILNNFPDVETVFIFNEQFSSLLTEYDNGFPEAIKSAHPNVTKVGFTVSTSSNFRSTDVYTETQMTSIADHYDVIGYNYYPAISIFENAGYVDITDFIAAFNNLENYIEFPGEKWITESGVLPYWEALSNPENYANVAVTRSITPQQMFFSALAKSIFAAESVKIVPWYMESLGMSNTPTYENMAYIFKTVIN